MSHTVRWPISIHVRKVIPFYLNDPVLQSSQTGYQTEGMMSLYMYSELFLTMRTVPYRAGVALSNELHCSLLIALRKRNSVKMHKFAFVADGNSQ